MAFARFSFHPGTPAGRPTLYARPRSVAVAQLDEPQPASDRVELDTVAVIVPPKEHRSCEKSTDKTTSRSSNAEAGTPAVVLPQRRKRSRKGTPTRAVLHLSCAEAIPAEVISPRRKKPSQKICAEAIPAEVISPRRKKPSQKMSPTKATLQSSVVGISDGKSSERPPVLASETEDRSCPVNDSDDLLLSRTPRRTTNRPLGAQVIDDASIQTEKVAPQLITYSRQRLTCPGHAVNLSPTSLLAEDRSPLSDHALLDDVVVLGTVCGPSTAVVHDQATTDQTPLHSPVVEILGRSKRSRTPYRKVVESAAQAKEAPAKTARKKSAKKQLFIG
ncbi:unnamed protein product [Linum trigynum]|uniref:Uncharacterized protein n=1 Tax=Linum trigynum TaxID=586398 RepID=A0AAV2FGK8_9ROSI